MSLQFSTAVGAGQLSALDDNLGASPLLEIFTGSQPASCAASDSGTKLSSIQLPETCLQVIGTTIQARLNQWLGVVDTAGIAAHFRVKDSTGATTLIQGSISRTGGAGDMILDNPTLTAGHTITVGTFKFTGASMATAVSSCTFSASVAIRGPLHAEIDSALSHIEDSMTEVKAEISSALEEIESVL